MNISIKDLAYIAGEWEGTGHAQYPTIKAIDFREKLIFSTNDIDTVIHFEQRTRIISSDENNNAPIFWDTGFLLDKKNGAFELVSAQKSGRLELLRGEARRIDEETIELPLASVYIVNDDCLIRSGRSFLFSKNEIRYTLKMSTAKNTDYQDHLTCRLTKTGL